MSSMTPVTGSQNRYPAPAPNVGRRPLRAPQPAPSTNPQPVPSPVPVRAAVWAGGGVVTITVLMVLALLGLAQLFPAITSRADLLVTGVITVHTLATLTWLVFVAQQHRVSARALGLTRPTWRLAHILWQVPVGLVLLILVQGVMALAFRADLPTSNSGAVAGLLTAGPVFTVIAVLIVGVAVPLWEELTFRGFVYGAVRARWGVLAAIALSAGLFAIAHVLPVMLPYFVAAGLWLGFLRWFHRTLWGPLLFHMALNLLVTVVILSVL